MRALVLVAALLLLPAGLAASAAQCPSVHDAALLPPPAVRAAQLRAAGFALRTLDAPALDAQVVGPPPLPDVPGASRCTGLIRPGAALILGHAYLCTADWVFEDARGALYLGTAGHCIPGQRVGPLDIQVIGLAGDIGDPVFARANGVGDDFGLIRIDPAFYGKVEPTLCHWGGPTMPEAAPVNVPDPLGVLAGPLYPTMEGQPALQYGWGVFYNANADTRARAGDLAMYDFGDGSSLAALPVAPGDSGSPAMTATGVPIGIVTHTVILGLVPGQPPVGDGPTFLTRIDRAEQMVRDATGMSVHVKLSTHPVDPTGLLTP